MKFLYLLLLSYSVTGNPGETLIRAFKLVTYFFNSLEPEVLTEKFNKINVTQLMLELGNIKETVEPKRLMKSRKFQHVNLNDIRLNLNNSLIGACFPESIRNGKCTCSSTYSNTISIFNNRDKVQSVITLNNQLKQIVVSHRPTLHLISVLDLLNYNLTSTDFAPSNVKVHGGILAGYLANKDVIKNEVLKYLEDPQFNEYSLHLTGYSLGGAIAIVSAIDWLEILRERNDQRSWRVLAYSSPRVGNQAFAQTLSDKNIPITRYTNSNDIVLHVPLRKDGYTHVGAEIYGETLPTSNYELKLCSQDWDEDPSCAWKNGNKLSIINHQFPFGKLVPVPPFC